MPTHSVQAQQFVRYMELHLDKLTANLGGPFIATSAIANYTYVIKL